MSEYTMELIEAIERLDLMGASLFPEYDYPEYIDSEKLKNLCISHYYYREIGQETLPRFVQRFQTKWLELLNEFDIKFKIVYDNLNSESALLNYSNTRSDKNTFKATPMSSLDPKKSYNTSITEVSGSSQGFQSNTNNYENITKILNNHNEVYNNFIAELDELFMGVL